MLNHLLADNTPWGVVYPLPPTALFPLAMGPGFFPEPLVPLDEDWTALAALAARHGWQLPLRWRSEVRQPGMALILTNAEQHICWVNAGFQRMSGYSTAEAVGRRPSFLQGAGTAEATRATIRCRLAQGRPFAGTVLNYRRGGEPYLCHVRIRPVRNAAGTLTHYLAFENEISPSLTP